MKPETEGEEKRMEAKAYLEQARNINIQIDSKLEQVSSLRQLAIKAARCRQAGHPIRTVWKKPSPV